MSETSTLRLTMDSGEFLSKLRKVGQTSKRVAMDGERKFRMMAKGMDSAKRSASGLNGKLKSGVALVGSLAVAAAGIGTIKGAVNLDAKYRHLAFGISTATKELVTAESVQRDVQKAAKDTARTSQEMVAAFDEVFGATKDLEFTRGVLGAIGTTATATGKSVGTIATVAQQLSRKFGTSAGEMGDALAQVFEASRQGGPDMEGMAQTMDVVGASVIQAGLKGKDALGFLLGALNATDAGMGGLGKQVRGITSILTKFGDPAQINKMAKALKIPASELLNEKDFLGQIKRVLSKGQKGLDTLKATFASGEEQKAMQILFLKPFEDALEQAKTAGMTGKAVTEQAVRALEGTIDDFGKATIKATDIQDQAAKEATKPQAQLRKAMETLTSSFADPAIIGAIDDLAENMPMLAKMFGNVVSFAAKNPILAGALGIGGHLGSSFFVGAAKQAGVALTGSFAASMAANGGSWGKAASGMLGTPAGKLFGAAAGAGMAVAIGLMLAQQIDNFFDRKRKAENKSIAGSVSARTGTPTSARERDAKLATIQKRKEELTAPRARIAAWAERKAGTAENLNNMRQQEYRELVARESQLQGMTSFSGPASAAAAPAPAATTVVATIDRGAMKLFASEQVNALKGVSLTAKLAHSGVPVSNVGGAGPRSMPPTVQGGGL